MRGKECLQFESDQKTLELQLNLVQCDRLSCCPSIRSWAGSSQIALSQPVSLECISTFTPRLAVTLKSLFYKRVCHKNSTCISRFPILVTSPAPCFYCLQNAEILACATATSRFMPQQFKTLFLNSRQPVWRKVGRIPGRGSVCFRVFRRSPRAAAGLLLAQFANLRNCVTVAPDVGSSGVLRKMQMACNERILKLRCKRTETVQSSCSCQMADFILHEVVRVTCDLGWVK